MKDFGAEVRASMDVDQFLQQAVLLLDVNETSLEGIVDRIVKKVSFLWPHMYQLFALLSPPPVSASFSRRSVCLLFAVCVLLCFCMLSLSFIPHSYGNGMQTRIHRERPEFLPFADRGVRILDD